MKNLFLIICAIIILAIMVLVVTGCTANQRAKELGGTMTVDLPVGVKLVVATWKDSDLWYLTRPMREGESAEVYNFQEQSEFGTLNGTVIFKEHLK